MRRTRPLVTRLSFVLALVLGAVTTLALRDHLAQLEARAAAPGPGRPVVVASVDLPRGSVLAATELRVVQLPERYVPPGTASDVAQVAGRRIAVDVLAGEPVTFTRLAPSGGPIAALVPVGLRAIAITAAVPSQVLAPGDRVDVLATFASGQEPHTETVVEGAEVLSVVAAAGLEESAGASTLVLLVSPDVAERLAFARAFADLAVAVAPPLEAAT